MIFFPKSIHLDFIFVRKLHKYNPQSFVQLSGVTLKLNLYITTDEFRDYYTTPVK